MSKKNFFNWQVASNNYKEVVINENFNLKSYLNKRGEKQVILTLTSEGKRKRIALDLFINPKNWDSNKQRAKKNAKKSADFNLVLDNIKSKLHEIRVQYRLNHLHLSMDQLIQEFRNDTPQFDFISFAEFHMPQMEISEGSKRKEKSHIKKLKEFKNMIPFSMITNSFLNQYRQYLLKEKKNNRNTTNANFRTICKYINLARDVYNIQINIDLKQVETKDIKTERVNLNLEEIKKLLNFFNSEFISENQKLSLGYFLFSCFCGCRISEIFSISRDDINNDYLSYWNSKSNKRITIQMNDKMHEVFNAEPRLFVDFISEQKTNENIKKICRNIGIKKKISFHIARHSFATNYLRLGGNIVDLQQLMGHSNIDTTMVYYHTVETEQINDMQLFNKI